MAGQRGAHRVGVLLPQPGAALDIGEQKHTIPDGRSARVWRGRAGTNAARGALRVGGGSRSGVSSARAQRMKSSRSSGASWSWVASRAAISREGRRASPSILTIRSFEQPTKRRQRVLGQVERFAAAFDPQAEREQRRISIGRGSFGGTRCPTLVQLLYAEMVPLGSRQML